MTRVTLPARPQRKSAGAATKSPSSHVSAAHVVPPPLLGLILRTNYNERQQARAACPVAC